MDTMTTTHVQDYLASKQIPQLMESLLTGLTYVRPDDPVHFLQACLDELQRNPDQPLKWSAFAKESEEARSRRARQQLPRTFYERNPSDPLLLKAKGKTPELHSSSAVAAAAAAAIPAPASNAKDSARATATTTTPQQETNIVFVLGGPGSGKGTNCAKLVAEFGLSHVSVGDLMRAEVAKGTAIGQQIDGMLKEGKIVPLSITLDVVKNSLREVSNPKGVLLDGFPREMAQAVEFEKQIGKPKFVLYFECTTELLEKRLLKRGEISGRADDNLDSIKKRFSTFLKQSLPVAKFYEEQGRLVKISSEPPVDEVYALTRTHFTK